MRTTSVIGVSGLGMVSSLGHSVVSSCAAARAGILRAFELKDGEDYNHVPGHEGTVTAHPIRHLTEGFSGLGRLVRLTLPSLEDLRNYSRLSHADLQTAGILLNLSDGYFVNALLQREADDTRAPTHDDEPIEGHALLQDECERLFFPRLCELAKVHFHPRYQKVFFGGSAGFASVLKIAFELLRTRRLERCIVGGVDSLVDPQALHALAELGVLKTSNHPVGLMPGEVAALLLLERRDAASKRGAQIQALLEDPGMESEDIHRFSGKPPQGAPLAKTISHTLLEMEGHSPGLLIGNLNGDDWKAQEWGNALIRLPRSIRDTRLWLPALAWGDTGAAVGAVSVCMAVRAFERGYAGTTDALIWLSSESGAKSAFHLQRVA